MNIPRAAAALDYIDDELVSAALEEPKKKRIAGWVKWCALAACLAAALAAGLSLRPDGSKVVYVGGVMREYADVSISSREQDVIWPWEYLTAAERYGSVTFNGVDYAIKSDRPVSRDFAGDAIGSGEAAGTDPYTGAEHRESFEVYRLSGISPELMLAVEMDGQLYAFGLRDYSPPSSLGEILDGFSLSDTLELERFRLCEGGSETGVCQLDSDDYIWQVLDQCREARFVEDYQLSGEYISFSATSGQLGVYKRVFSISADGYVSTNVFNWGYAFEIGAAAASDVISYVKANSVEVQDEPYAYYLAGSFAGTEDGFVLVDDSALCADSADGIVFRVPASDVRISRWLELQEPKPGDIVVVGFTEPVDTASGNVVSGVISIAAGFLDSGGVSVTE